MLPAASNPRRASARRTLASLLILALVLAACNAHPASTAPVIRIGLVAPFEGHSRDIGYDVIYGARLAVRERNRDGGVACYRVELVALDDSGDPELAMRAAESLVIDPLTMAAIGHWDEATTAAVRPIYAASRLPLLIPDGVLTEPGELPADFVARYEAVTPFDEEPGPRAAAAYDACYMLFDAIQAAIERRGRPGRAAVAEALAGLAVNGVSGPLRTEPLDGLNQRLVRAP